MSKTTETHTCPDCGQGGFTDKGLKAHQGNKTCKSRALVKAEPDKPAKLKEFDTARKHVETIRELGRRASHTSILLGHELLRLKAELGERRGGNRKGKHQSTQNANFDRWDDLVEAQTGLSYDTCQRCMTLAQAAKKHLPLLTAKDVIEKPFSALPAARQTEVLKTLEKVADGQSMNQLMHAFGAWKDKKAPAPPKATKQSAKKRAENANDEVLQALLTSESAEEFLNQVQSITVGFPEFQGVLTDEDLAAWETQTAALLEAVRGELKKRRAAK